MLCIEVNGGGRMYPFYFDCGGGGGSSAVNPWFSTSDCKPIFDDRSTSWIATTPGIGRTLSPTPAAYFPTAAATSTFYPPPPQNTRYVTRHSSPADVMESPLVTSYGCVTSSLGSPAVQSSGVDSALMSAALLHSAAAAAAEVNMMKNLPEHLSNTGVMTNDSEALRLRTKSHSSSGK